jgi:hypothetical protein
MGTELVPETLVYYDNQLARPIAREHFIDTVLLLTWPKNMFINEVITNGKFCKVGVCRVRPLQHWDGTGRPRENRQRRKFWVRSDVISDVRCCFLTRRLICETTLLETNYHAHIKNLQNYSFLLVLDFYRRQQWIWVTTDTVPFIFPGNISP